MLAIDAQLDDGGLERVGQPTDPFGPLQCDGDVLHRDQILDLEGGQRTGHLVEAAAIALQRLDGLVGPVQEHRDLLEHVLLVAAVHGDGVHALGDGDDGHVDGPSHPLGGAVPGAGLGRGDVGVGHQVHVGPGDPAGIAGQDERAVHLGQLVQPLGAERRNRAGTRPSRC